MNRPAVRSRLIASASLCGRSAVTMIESLWAARSQAYKCNGQTIFARSEVVDREITWSVRYGGNAFRLQLESSSGALTTHRFGFAGWALGRDDDRVAVGREKPSLQM